MNRETSRLNRLMHNNKFLLVAAFLIAIAIWASIKVNYSDKAERTIYDVKVSINMPSAEANGYKAFYDEGDLYVDVVVSGRSFDINAQAFSRDDLVVEAAVGYVDAGYRTVNLSARSTNPAAEIVEVTPSSVTLFFDREATQVVNVKPRLTNRADTLTEGDYVIEALQATSRTVNVTGPASVVETLSEVIFEATIDPARLPLTATEEVAAEIRYDLSEANARFLTCDAEKPGITVPVKRELTVPATVSFINQPAAFNDTPPEYKIDPATVLIRTTNAETNSFPVGKIDFSTLKNGVNQIKLPAPSVEGSAELQEEITKFTVTVDLSGYARGRLDLSENQVTFTNGSEASAASATAENLQAVTVIGSQSSLDKLDPQKIELLVDLQNWKEGGGSVQSLPVTILLKPDEIAEDCWVYGTYTVSVRMRTAQ
ncbi:MAG: hypothetical protein IKN72_03235 [Clostridia bacterium]|nr:hypothetical protein [Clostridia bacterium]